MRHYEVDGVKVSHFKTALRIALKTNARLLVRHFVSKNFKRHTVLVRNGKVLNTFLTKSQRKLSKRFFKKSAKTFKYKPYSKYQLCCIRKLRVRKFNEYSYQRQQRFLTAEWHRTVYKTGVCQGEGLTVADIQKRLEGYNFKFKLN